MRKAAGVALAMLVVVAAVGAGQAKVDRAAVEKQLIANERAINEAFAKNDATGFMMHVDPQGIGIDPSGPMKVTDVTSMIAKAKVASWNIDNSKVLWVDDNTAIHYYRWTGKGTMDGQPFPSPVYASTVWANKGAKWLAVFHQETSAMPPPPPAKKR